MTLFMNKNRVSSALWVSFIAVATLMSCSSSQETAMVPVNTPEVAPLAEAVVPAPDPRVGLDAGLFDAEEAVWNLEVLSQTPPPEKYIGKTNSDLAFQGNYSRHINVLDKLIFNVEGIIFLT